MSLNPLISVIMSVYNGEKFLIESIDSIISQTYKNIEFIIVNDGSRDNTAEILEYYKKKDSRIKILHQKNNGLAASLNIAIKMARGDYIARMDSDDIALPERLETQLNAFRQNPQIGLCHTLFSVVNSHGEKIFLKRLAGFRFTPIQTRWTLLWRNCICHPTVMIRKDILEKYNQLYDVSMICQDYELWCRLISYTEFYTCKKPLLLLRKHEGCVSARYDEAYLEKFKFVISRNIKRYMETAPSNKDLRGISLLSGQMYLRGKRLIERINYKTLLRIINNVTFEFIKKHAVDPNSKREVNFALGHQLIRWAQQAWYSNKRASLRFLVAGLYKLIFSYSKNYK